MYVYEYIRNLWHYVMDRINPSAVLDFLWACLHKPCLWQERVKKEAIVNSSISLVSEVHTVPCKFHESLLIRNNGMVNKKNGT